jgi:hypothetical protein
MRRRWIDIIALWLSMVALAGVVSLSFTLENMSREADIIRAQLRAPDRAPDGFPLARYEASRQPAL